jgi:hypothetical protein
MAQKAFAREVAGSGRSGRTSYGSIESFIPYSQKLHGMIDTFAGNVKGFILDPVETFRRSGTDTPAAVFTYLGVLLLINAILSALVAAAVGFGSTNTPAGMSAPVMVFFLVLIGGFILSLIGAAWIHLWVYLLGGRRGFLQTLAAVIYGGTPGQLLGWIPLIGIISSLWSLALVVLGIRELQALGTAKAILAVAIAVIIPLALILLAASYFMIGSTTMTPVLVPPG